jgi:hypothetical protein
MKSRLLILILLLASGIAFGQTPGPYGVFGGPIASSKLPSGAPSGTIAFTSDQGQMVSNGSTWVVVSSSTASIASGTILGNSSGSTAAPSANAPSVYSIPTYPVQSWETGVTNSGYAWGDIRRFGGVGDGATNSTTAINNWAASITPGLALSLEPNGVYEYNPNTVTNGFGFNSSSAHNLVIYGNGATIQAIAGALITAGNHMLFFGNAQDIDVYNLWVDGNRANRGAGVGNLQSDNIDFQDLSARIHLHNVRSINSAVDGFGTYVQTPGTLSRYPTDILLDHCSDLNPWRNGISLDGSVRFYSIQGRYWNATTSTPEAGVDIEADTNITYGNTGFYFFGDDVSNNGLVGLEVTGDGSSAPSQGIIRGLTGVNNGGNLILVSGNVSDLWIDGTHVGAQASISNGALSIGSGSANVNTVKITNTVAANMTGPIIDVSAAVPDRTLIQGFKFENITGNGIICFATCTIKDGTATSETGIVIENAAAYSDIRNITCDTSNQVLYNSGAYATVDGVMAKNCQTATGSDAALYFDSGSTTPTIRNIDIYQSSSIPGGTTGIGANAAVVPAEIINVNMTRAGSAYTVAQAWALAGGTATTVIANNNPAISQSVYSLTGQPGEYWDDNCPVVTSGASIAFTSATPTVGTWSSPPWAASTAPYGSYACTFEITANAPTGLSTATIYLAVPINATTFHVATSAAQAMAGNYAATTGSSSTANLTTGMASVGTGFAIPVGAMKLTAGEWKCQTTVQWLPASTTSVTQLEAGITASSSAFGTLGTYNLFETAANVMTATANPTTVSPLVDVLISSATPEYAMSEATFTVSTVGQTGDFNCTRVH